MEITIRLEEEVKEKVQIICQRDKKVLKKIFLTAIFEKYREIEKDLSKDYRIGLITKNDFFKTMRTMPGIELESERDDFQKDLNDTKKTLFDQIHVQVAQ